MLIVCKAAGFVSDLQKPNFKVFKSHRRKREQNVTWDKGGICEAVQWRNLDLG